MASSLLIRLISGQSRQINGLTADTKFLTLREKIAEEMELLLIEVGICHNERKFSIEDDSQTLGKLGLLQGDVMDEIAVLRLPRLRLDVIEGEWMNSKGTLIKVSGQSANIAGLVTWDVHVDRDGTVTGVGDYLKVQEGFNSLDVIAFHGEKWWRKRGEDDDEFAVILRTVAGASKRLEMQPTDTLSALREQAVAELAEILDLHTSRDSITFSTVADVASTGSAKGSFFPRSFDHLTLSELGIKSGISLLCTRN